MQIEKSIVQYCLFKNLFTSAFPLGHGGSPQYRVLRVDGEETFFVSFKPPGPTKRTPNSSVKGNGVSHYPRKRKEPTKITISNSKKTFGLLVNLKIFRRCTVKHIIQLCHVNITRSLIVGVYSIIF